MAPTPGIYEPSSVSSLIPYRGRVMSEGGSKSHLAHVTKDGRLACVVYNDHLDFVRTSNGHLQATWFFGHGTGSSCTEVICVDDLRTNGATKVIVCLTLQDVPIVCVFDMALSRVTRAVRLPHQVRCMEVVCSQSDHILDHLLVEQLKFFSGVVAVGTEQGHVYLIDLCLADTTVLADAHNPRHIEMVTPRTRDTADLRVDAIKHGRHMCMHLDEESHLEHYVYRGACGDTLETLDKRDVCVTALLYIRESATLAIGFNFGSYQLWKLSCPVLEYSSSYDESSPPVSHFTHQLPENDPRNFSYLWVAHGPTPTDTQANIVSSMVLYQLSYKKKAFYSQYGTFFEDLLTVGCRFEMYLTPHVYTLNAACDGSRVLACHTVHDPLYTAPPRLDAGESFEESVHGPDLSLCVVVWETRTPHKTQFYLGLFDMNRWYHSQMPTNFKPMTSTDDQCPYMAVYCLDNVLVDSSQDSLMDVFVDWRSIQKYVNNNSPISPEQHFYPAALKFDTLCVLTAGVVKARFLGLQRQTLVDLVTAGPQTLIDPSHIHHLCVTRALLPRAITSPGCQSLLVEQREDVLTMCVDHDLVAFIRACITHWASDSEYMSEGCTLKFLLGWAWKKLGQCKDVVNKTTIPLFDWSGTDLDTRSMHTLYTCSHDLDLLTVIFRSFLTQATPVTEEGCSELLSKLQVCELISQHVKVMLWALHQGLLPEREDLDDTPGPGYCYPLTDLLHVYRTRRDHLSNLHSSTPASDLLMIDGLLREMGACVSERWVYGGGDGSYPPPSLNEMLNLYLIDGPPLVYKHCVILYLLLDLHSLHDPDHSQQHELMERLCKFPQAFTLPRNDVAQVTAFWHLDHGYFEEAVSGLTGCSHILGPWQHERVIRALLYQGQPRLALRYLRVKQPTLVDTPAVKLRIDILLANGLMAEALGYLRSCDDDVIQRDLMVHVIRGCRQLKAVKQLLEQPFTADEDAILCDYLRNHDDISSRQLLVLYYLLRSRYVEAIRLNDDIRNNPAVKHGRNEIQEAHNVIVDQYRSLLPSVQRQFIFGQPVVKSRQASIIKTVVRPRPLSTVVVRHCDPNRMSTRSHVISAVMDKIRELTVAEMEQSLHGACGESAIIPATPCEPFVFTPMTPRSTTRLSTSRFTFTDLDPPTTHTVHPLTSLTPSLKPTSRRRTLTENALSMLKTPPVTRRSRSRFSGISRSPQPTPQSILKVRLPLQRQQSPLHGHLSGALTPPLATPKRPAHTDISVPTTPKQLRFADSVIVTTPDTPTNRMSAVTNVSMEDQILEDLSLSHPGIHPDGVGVGHAVVPASGSSFMSEERVVLRMASSSSDDEDITVDSPLVLRVAQLLGEESPFPSQLDGSDGVPTPDVFETPPERPHTSTLHASKDAGGGPVEELFSHQSSPVNIREADSSCDIRNGQSLEPVNITSVRQATTDISGESRGEGRGGGDSVDGQRPQGDDAVQKTEMVARDKEKCNSEIVVDRNLLRDSLDDTQRRGINVTSDEGGGELPGSADVDEELMDTSDIDYTPRERRSIHDSLSPPCASPSAASPKLSPKRRIFADESDAVESSHSHARTATKDPHSGQSVGLTSEDMESPYPVIPPTSEIPRTPLSTSRRLQSRLTRSIDREVTPLMASPRRSGRMTRSVDRDGPPTYTPRGRAKNHVERGMVEPHEELHGEVDGGSGLLGVDDTTRSSPGRRGRPTKVTNSESDVGRRSVGSVRGRAEETGMGSSQRRGSGERRSGSGERPNLSPRNTVSRQVEEPSMSAERELVGSESREDTIKRREEEGGEIYVERVCSVEEEICDKESADGVGQASPLRRSMRASSVERSLATSNSPTTQSSPLRRSTRASSVERSLVTSNSPTTQMSPLRRSTRASSVERSLVTSNSPTTQTSPLRRSTRASSVERSLVTSNSPTTQTSPLRRRMRASSVERSLVFARPEETSRRSGRAQSVESSIVSPALWGRNRRAMSVEMSDMITQTTPGLTKRVSKTPARYSPSDDPAPPGQGVEAGSVDVTPDTRRRKGRAKSVDKMLESDTDSPVVQSGRLRGTSVEKPPRPASAPVSPVRSRRTRKDDTPRRGTRKVVDKTPALEPLLENDIMDTTKLVAETADILWREANSVLDTMEPVTVTRRLSQRLRGNSPAQSSDVGSAGRKKKSTKTNVPPSGVSIMKDGRVIDAEHITLEGDVETTLAVRMSVPSSDACHTEWAVGGVVVHTSDDPTYSVPPHSSWHGQILTCTVRNDHGRMSVEKRIVVLGEPRTDHDGGHREQDSGHREQDSGHREQDSGHREQDSGHREQDSGHREQDSGHREQDSGHREQDSGHREQDSGHREQDHTPRSPGRTQRRMTLDTATLSNTLTPRSPPTGVPPSKRGRQQLPETPCTSEADVPVDLLSPLLDADPTPRPAVRRRSSQTLVTTRTRRKKFGGIFSHRL